MGMGMGMGNLVILSYNDVGVEERVMMKDQWERVTSRWRDT